MELKDIIRKYRKDLGISQEELGNRIGVCKQTIQKYESGTVSNIPYEKIISLSSALNITPATLLDAENPNPQQSVILEKFYSLSDSHKEALLQYADFLLSQQ